MHPALAELRKATTRVLDVLETPDVNATHFAPSVRELRTLWESEIPSRYREAHGKLVGMFCPRDPCYWSAFSDTINYMAGLVAQTDPRTFNRDDAFFQAEGLYTNLALLGYHGLDIEQLARATSATE